MMNFNEVYTTKEAGELYGLADNTVNVWCQRGRFTPAEARQSGKTWLVTKAGMDRLTGPDKRKEIVHPKSDVLDRAKAAVAENYPELPNERVWVEHVHGNSYSIYFGHGLEIGRVQRTDLKVFLDNEGTIAGRLCSLLAKYAEIGERNEVDWLDGQFRGIFPAMEGHLEAGASPHVYKWHDMKIKVFFKKINEDEVVVEKIVL